MCFCEFPLALENCNPTFLFDPQLGHTPYSCLVRQSLGVTSLRMSVPIGGYGYVYLANIENFGCCDETTCLSASFAASKQTLLRAPVLAYEP